MIDGRILQAYKSGIIENIWCPYPEKLDLNYAVLIVGYENDYYIAKTSFGPSWGENGYFRIRMADGDGVCGLNKDAKYPII